MEEIHTQLIDTGSFQLFPTGFDPSVDIEAIVTQRKPIVRKPSQEAIQAVKRKLSSKHSDVSPDTNDVLCSNV